MDNKNTLTSLLNELKKAGYTKLAFSCYDPDIRESKLRGVYAEDTFWYERAYLYTHPNRYDLEWRPSLWDILANLNISYCGGSNNCHGLKRDFAEYVGAYSYRLVNSKWIRLPRKYDDIWLREIINSISSMYLYRRYKPLDILSDDYDVIAIAELKKVSDVLLCSIEDMPLYINDCKRCGIAKWRLLTGT